MNYNDFMAYLDTEQTESPVNLLHISQALHLGIYKSTQLHDKTSGLILKATGKYKTFDKGCGFAIIINANYHKRRQRFTIAHEIAHYILHKDKIHTQLSDSILYRSENLSRDEELQAHQLTADILMPWSLINKEIKKGLPYQNLAKKFEVSPSAMSIRIGVPLDDLK